VHFLSTIDFIVDDVQTVCARFSDTFSLLSPRTSWFQRLDSHRYEAAYGRAGDAYADAPSRLQFWSLLSDHDVAEAPCHSYLAPVSALVARQADRPQKIHATVLAVDDVEAAIAWLAARKVPAQVEPPCEHFPFQRVWIGWQGSAYADPADTGLYLELIPAAALPASATTAGASALRDRTTRLGWRMFVVEDLGAAITMMRATLGLEPAEAWTDSRLKADCVRYTFKHPGSASLVLAEPHDAGPARSYIAEHGPGAYILGIYATEPAAALAHALSSGAHHPYAGLDHLLTDAGTPAVVVSIEDYPA
jgi:hypothetical protein